MFTKKRIQRTLGSFVDSIIRRIIRILPRLTASYFFRDDGKRLNILVVGVYLADRKNTAAQLAREFSTSKHYKVTQHWAVIGKITPDPYLASLTSVQVNGKIPRSIMINRLLSLTKLEEFDYLVVCDDDVVVRRGFLDLYLGLQTKHDLALAQPARTKNSWIDHPITRQVASLECRFTRFVEVGPVFSMHRSLFKDLLPLNTGSPMGWGLDFVWPLIVESMGKKMGIIDATPVDHSLRQPKTGYANKVAGDEMRNFLAKTSHLSEAEAHVTLSEIKLGNSGF